jgi:hypothetical protein
MTGAITRRAAAGMGKRIMAACSGRESTACVKANSAGI